MSARIPARNPLFLREDELDRHLELLLLAQRDLAVRAESVRQSHDLSEAEVQILYLLSRHPGATLAEIGAVLGTPKQSLSRQVRGLVERDLLRQEAARSDARKRPLQLTDPGRERLAAVTAVSRARLRRALVSAGPEAVEGFQRVLIELIDGPTRRWSGAKAA